MDLLGNRELWAWAGKLLLVGSRWVGTFNRTDDFFVIDDSKPRWCLLSPVNYPSNIADLSFAHNHLPLVQLALKQQLQEHQKLLFEMSSSSGKTRAFELQTKWVFLSFLSQVFSTGFEGHGRKGGSLERIGIAFKKVDSKGGEGLGRQEGTKVGME